LLFVLAAYFSLALTYLFNDSVFSKFSLKLLFAAQMLLQFVFELSEVFLYLGHHLEVLKVFYRYGSRLAQVRDHHHAFLFTFSAHLPDSFSSVPEVRIVERLAFLVAGDFEDSNLTLALGYILRLFLEFDTSWFCHVVFNFWLI